MLYSQIIPLPGIPTIVFNTLQTCINNSIPSSLLDKLNVPSDIDYVIAGGYPRDLIHNISPTDIDVFYKGTFPVEWDVLFTAEEVDIQYETTTFKVTHEGIYGLYKVQFIKVLELGSALLNSFSCSLSQCFINSNKVLFYTADFIESVFDKTNKWKPDTTHKYKSKIVAKYFMHNHIFLEYFTEAGAISNQISFTLAAKKKIFKYKILNVVGEHYREFT